MKPQITRSITGLGIIIVGALLLLDNLHFYNFDNLFSQWWPLLVIAAGLLMLAGNRQKQLWPWMVVIFGVVYQLRELSILNVNPWQLFWPGVLILIGVSILTNRSAAARSVSRGEREDTSAIFAGNDIRNTSDDFKGSNMTAIMGGVKYDLRKATIKKEATIEVFAFWGGVEIIVPRNVIVKNQTTAIMAGVEDKTDQEVTANSPIIYLTGEVIMAGVEVKN